MVAHILFPANDRREDISIRRINGCRIESGWQILTDTADISIPRRYLMRDARISRLQDVIKKGDQVIISLGYGQDLREEFRGYVTDVNTEEPVLISCEDEMWKLKQVSVNKSWQKVTLNDMLKEIVPSDYTVDAIDVDLGDIGFERMTVAQILQELKDRYNLYSYFKGKTLVSGKIYLDNVEEVTYDFQKNIVSHGLIYRAEDDLKIKVRAQSIQSDGSTIEVIVGDEDGEESKLVYRNMTEAGLRKMAEQDLEKLKKDGYKGGLTSFGIPFIQHGYTSKLINKFHPEREGKYYIEHVITIFNDSPAFRRDVTIGRRAANV